VSDALLIVSSGLQNDVHDIKSVILTITWKTRPHTLLEPAAFRTN